MKTYKQTITENKSGDDLYEIKLAAVKWWKENSNQPTIKPIKKDMEKVFNQVLMGLDSAIDMVYESEPDKN